MTIAHHTNTVAVGLLIANVLHLVQNRANRQTTADQANIVVLIKHAPQLVSENFVRIIVIAPRMKFAAMEHVPLRVPWNMCLSVHLTRTAHMMNYAVDRTRLGQILIANVLRLVLESRAKMITTAQRANLVVLLTRNAP